MTDVLVLCYHAVSPTWPAALSVTPDALERQLTGLVRRGWRGATFHQAMADPPAARTLAVTFDDAFRSVLSLAHPVLSSLRLPATLFVPTTFPGSGRPLSWEGIEQWQQTEHAGELAALDWPQIGELAQDGWEIGSHTRTHPHLTRVDEATVQEELAESRREVEAALGTPCRTIAYPYGDVDDAVAATAQAAGYEAGAALPADLTPRGRFRWPRVGIYHGDTAARFALKVSPLVRRARAATGR